MKNLESNCFSLISGGGQCKCYPTADVLETSFMSPRSFYVVDFKACEKKCCEESKDFKRWMFHINGEGSPREGDCQKVIS